jgi:hypothetical protein
MSRRHDIQDATGRLVYLPGRGTVQAWGTGAPTNSAPGFAPGCIYHRLDGGAGTGIYVNEGTFASATWVALGTGATFSTLTVTTLSSTTGTITTLGTTTLTATTANITTLNPTSIVRASQRYQAGRGLAKAGTTAGWVVNAGNNLGTIATLPQSQTGSTLIVGLPGLHVGDTITGFSVYSCINSAGGTVTLDANLRSLTIAAGATATDASIDSIAQVSVTSATASTATKSGLSTVITAGVNYYLLLTATTGGSCTIELDQIELVVTTG